MIEYGTVVRTPAPAGCATVSFLGDNYAARPLGFRPAAAGDAWHANHAHLAPASTYPERFAEMVSDVRAAGFPAMDLWTGHLHRSWAMPDHVRAARAVLKVYRMSVPSITGDFGGTEQEFRWSCALARALDAPLLSGTTSLLATDRRSVVRLLRRFDLTLAVLHDRLADPLTVLRRIGNDRTGRIGVAVDTGWCGTLGIDVAATLEAVAPRLRHVRLRDVAATGSAPAVSPHNCPEVLARLGYGGPIAIAHESWGRDPAPAAAARRSLVLDQQKENR